MKNFIRAFLISISTSFCLAGQLQFASSQTASILPQAETQFLNNNGDPITSGTVDFYIPNSSTRKTTWQDADRTIANTNPVKLNASGRALIYGYGGYRQVVKDRNGNLIWDRVTNSYSIPNGQITTGDGNNVGTILQWSALVAPNQYVFAYGQELSRITYPELFSAITLVQNVNCTSSSNSLSGVADTSQIPIGAVIEASCFASAVTVTGKTSNTYIVSANATVTTTVQATVFPFGNGNAVNTFNVPDLRGRILAGRDNMGGIAASRLTTTYFANASAIGSVGGSQSHTLTVSESAVLAYTSTVHDPGHKHISFGVDNNPGTQGSVNGTNLDPTFNTNTSTSTTGITVDTVSNAGGQAHSIVQPTITINYIIKVTPDQTGLAAAGVLTLGTMAGIIACDNTFSCAFQSVGLSVISNDTVLANVSGGNAQATATTFTQWLDAVCSNVQGNVIYRGASSWNCLTPGTTGQLLKTQGAASNPIWGNAVETVTNDTNVTGSVSGLNLTFGWAGQLSVPRGGTGVASFTADLPLIGNGAGAIAQGTRSGNTTDFATTDGTFTGGSCVKYDNFGNLTPTGAVCGGGGGGGSGGNPTATIPLDNTAVNGAAVTFTRSDGAPKLSKYTSPLTGAVARTVQSKFQDVVSILDFGGDNTGTNDNGAACTAMYNALGIHTGGTVIFPPGQYKFATSCVIPAFDANGGTGATPIIRTEMSGAQLFPAGNGIAILDRFPANQTEADNTVSARYEFIGGQFIGIDPNTGIQISSQNTGLRLGASYTTYIEGTLFSFLRVGLDLQFALNAKVESIRCSRIDWYCVIAREGQWTGATTNNSQSNDTLFENIRDSSNNGQLASFYIHATDGVIIRNSICEGGNPVTCILFDDDRNTTVKSLKIDGLHVENAGSGTVNAIITMLGSGGGVYTIQNVFNQTVGTLLDVSGFDSSGQTFNILDIDYTGGFVTPFKTQVTDANRWNFRGWFGNIRASTNWSGGHVPDNLHNLNGSTITANKLTFGDSAALNTPAWGIAVYGMANPVLDNMFDLGAAGILRWAGIYVGSNGVNSSDLAGSGTSCLYTNNDGKIIKTGSSSCGGTGVALMGSASSLNGQSTGDVATLTLNYPIGTTYFFLNSTKLFARSGAFNTMQVGIYTGPGQTGTVVCAQAVAGVSATGFNTNGAAVSLTCGGLTSTAAINAPTLYVNVGTGQGTANSFDISVYGNVH